MKPSKRSLEIAAQCWCDDETKDRVMDTKLAIAFAKRFDLETEAKNIAVQVLIKVRKAWGKGLGQEEILRWIDEALELVCE
jgi:hypothetical protein